MALAPVTAAAYKAAVGGPRLVVAAFLLLVIVVAGGWVGLRAKRAAPPSATVAAHQMPAVRRSADPFQRWSITEQFAAQSVLVVQVETRQLGQALAIAREIATPLQDRYIEIMMYFHRPGRPDTLPPRRVQWTRASGFVETDLEAQ